MIFDADKYSKIKIGNISYTNNTSTATTSSLWLRKAGTSILSKEITLSANEEYSLKELSGIYIITLEVTGKTTCYGEIEVPITLCK